MPLLQLACNAHSICDSELRPLGTGLYPVISIINHSCLPNSVLMFEGRTAVVRAVEHIPKGANKLYRNRWKHHDSAKGVESTISFQLLMPSLHETGAR